MRTALRGPRNTTASETTDKTLSKQRSRVAVREVGRRRTKLLDKTFTATSQRARGVRLRWCRGAPPQADRNQLRRSRCRRPCFGGVGPKRAASARREIVARSYFVGAMKVLIVKTERSGRWPEECSLSQSSQPRPQFMTRDHEKLPCTPGFGEIVCPKCNGKGLVYPRPCTTCLGSGRVVQTPGG